MPTPHSIPHSSPKNRSKQNSPSKPDPEDVIFLRVRNWNQCSRCLWHLENLHKEISIIPRSHYSNKAKSASSMRTSMSRHTQSSQPPLDRSHTEPLPPCSTDEESFGSDHVMHSISPLRLSEHQSICYPFPPLIGGHGGGATNKSSSITRCTSSPHTPSHQPMTSDISVDLQLSAVNMVKSTSLPNLQDVYHRGGRRVDLSPRYSGNGIISPERSPNITPLLQPQISHHLYTNKFSLNHNLKYRERKSSKSVQRRFEIDHHQISRLTERNVIPIGYSSVMESQQYPNGQCKDHKERDANAPKALFKSATLTQFTALRFIYDAYRMVITLDISSSIGVMNPTTRCVTFEHYFPILRDFLLLIARPIEFECLVEAMEPVLYLTVIAVGLPEKELVVLINQQLKCGDKQVFAFLSPFYPRFCSE